MALTDISERAAAAYAWLTAVVDASTDAIIGQTLDGTITWWSTGAARLYGYTSEEAVGRRIDTLTARGREAEIRELIDRVSRGGHVSDRETTRLRKDGSAVEIALSVSPIRASDGSVLGLASVARDISQRKRLEAAAREAELRFRTVVEQALVGVYIIEDNRFTYVNRKMADTFGYTQEEMLALPSVLLVVDTSERDRVAERIRVRLERGEPVQYETLGRRKDGSPINIEVHGGVIDVGKRRATGVVLDVTEHGRMDRELRSASAYARGLLEATLDPLVTISTAGKITDVNRATEEATGRSREELIGTDFADYFLEPERARAGYQQVLDHGRVRDYALTLQHRTGRTIDVLYNATVYHNEAGELQGVFAAARDVTELNRAYAALAEREERLKEAQAVAHVGSWSLDLATSELAWTDEVYRIFGLEPQSAPATYQFFLDHVHPDDRAMVNAAYTTSVATRQPYTVDHRILLADGSVRVVHERCVTFYDADGKALRSVGTVQDITDRKRAEEALNRLNAELEARVAARTAELVTANKELEAFSYSVSHDLRAPLRALQGFSRILLEEHLEALPDDAKRYVGVIRDNAAQMGSLVDDLLAFARLSRQSLRTEPVDIAAIARETFDQLAGERAGREVEIRIGALPECQGDPVLLRQVFMNLLSNALKFTRQQAHAVIEIGVAHDLEGSDENVYFVRDNGVGFDMQYAGKLFGIFQRLHAAHEYEGTGVGLAIVQRIVHRHGGSVWAESAPNAGAVFYFALPRLGLHGS